MTVIRYSGYPWQKSERFCVEPPPCSDPTLAADTNSDSVAPRLFVHRPGRDRTITGLMLPPFGSKAVWISATVTAGALVSCNGLQRNSRMIRSEQVSICAELDASTAVTRASALRGIRWTSVAREGQVIDEEFTITFGAEKISGSAGPNSFSGVYTATDDGTLKISNLTSTAIGSASAETTAEYLRMLVKAQQFAVAMPYLCVFGARGSNGFLFRAEEGREE